MTQRTMEITFAYLGKKIHDKMEEFPKFGDKHSYRGVKCRKNVQLSCSIVTDLKV